MVEMPDYNLAESNLLCIESPRERADVVEMLLGAGADADLRDGLGGGALLGAAQAGHHRIIDSLTAHGATCAPQESPLVSGMGLL